MDNEETEREEAVPEQMVPPSREEFDALVAEVRRLAAQVVNSRA